MAMWMDTVTKERTWTLKDFFAPEPFFGPVYSWVWNAPVDENTVRKHIDEMQLAGIKAFYIIPEPPEFRPETMITTMTPPYLSAEYFSLVRLAVEYARDKGMLVWIYDEGGWPSGNACGQLVKARPDLAGKTIAARDVVIKAGEAYNPGEMAVAAFKDRKRIPEGEIFAEETTIQEYYRHIITQSANPILPDLLEPETIPLFIALTHERYCKALGDLAENVVPCVFIDEPQTPMPAFPWDFSELFRAKFGYDIEDYLYVLMEDQELSSEASQARQDYANLIRELHVTRFMEPIRTWCREHNLIFTGHLDKDHAMDQYCKLYGNPMSLLRKMDMPGIDVIWRQIWQGETPVVEGESFFPRMAASVAGQNGQLLTLSESFGVYSENLTPEDMRWVCNYQFVRGISILNPMNIPYGREGALAYGGRPYFCREMPGYAHLTQWNRHMSRISYFMTCGLPTTDAALYLPAERFWRDRSEAEAALKAYHDLGEKLEAEGISFDIIDREGILQGQVRDGKLCVGLARYGKIFVPQGIALPDDVRRIVEQLDGTTVSWAWSDHPALKIRTRMDTAGNLYVMVFCQSLTAVSGTITVKTALPCWQADAADGCLKPLTGAVGEQQVIPVTLEAGQEMLILASRQPVSTKEPDECALVRTAVLQDCRRTMKLMLTEEGLVRDETVQALTPAQDFASMEDENFSGEITYGFALNLTKDDLKGTHVLTLDRLEHSAKIVVNGVFAGYLCLRPYRLILDNQHLHEGENRLEIEVANTASNIYAAADPYVWFDGAHIGPYHDRERNMERERRDGGLFGDVCVEIWR